MPLLALLVIACQVTCGLHVVRSGQERYWLYLIIALPGLGCLIYFLGIMLPDMLGSRRGRRALNQLHDSIDPQRHLRALRDELDIRDTRETRINLADELLRMGQPEEAATHYQMALRGIHTDAPDILLGLARARFALDDFAGCRDALERLIDKNPDFRSADGHLLYARALEGLGDDLKAEEEYQALNRYYAGPEASYRYALLLARLGRLREARELHEQIRTHARRAARHYRTLHKEWLDLSQQALRNLQAD
ncbi:tetratricopeptide repeat protein [Pseudomonas sp. GD03944]|uniref:tetratricopeptide repeat protein n=1 Tax=Pseudomonas sp. GD03944 TaxID=2975409 RepID=UPI0024492302|nr:tetratricopeptide repeat protein [Pseudomonas sp. GD03944]MDH1265517.1 tetratricopeptide repeat protein [Pseudomonas sp. GD03944]